MATQGLQQQQKQVQTMVLAPQLRQSLKILQVATLDLRSTIMEELETNPALEELPMETVSLEERLNGKSTESGDDTNPADNSDSSQAEPSIDTTENNETSEGANEKEESSNSEEIDFSDDFEVFTKLDEEWQEYYRQESQTSEYSNEAEKRRQYFFDSLVSETSLQEHLMEQAEFSDCGEKELEAIRFLIGSLDDRGFLTSPLSDVALLSSMPLATMKEAREILRNFDPPGIGSEDIRECLLFQLSLRGEQDSPAYKIIDKWMDLLLRRRIPELARKIGISKDEIQEVIEHIAELDPNPGSRFRADTNSSISPDAQIEWDGNKWVININNDYIPRLRINPIYKQLIAKGTLSKKEKDYIQERMRSGKFLMGSIEQRQQTIKRISNEILKFQKDFFEEGVSALKPLTMNQVAESIDVHETTVSRAIANKYLETPHGTFPFKYFFTAGYENAAGESISNRSVKDSIAKIIEGENPVKPLSDQAIANLLAKSDIKIARRTVAKYREEIGVLPTNLRRQYD
ncbi:MAG: RNA polymerase factor sigma-54 [Opitutae bacterium]|nr:RNA polymerase factor sigma-54 [Opitutae bacterium]